MNSNINNLDQYLVQMFDIIRVVDPLKNEIIDDIDNKVINNHKCYEFWNKKGICKNCISARAYEENKTIVKIEYNGEKLYWVMATPIEKNGKNIL